MNKRREKAIEFLQKQRRIEVQMLEDMDNYITPRDRKYNSIKQGFVDKINTIDFILMRI